MKITTLFIGAKRSFRKLSILVLGALFILSPLSSVHVSATPSVPTGIWYSTWYTNNGKYVWADGHGSGSKTQLMGDVNGDGKDDSVAFFDTSPSYLGSWYVATSNGSSFNGNTNWPVNGNSYGYGSGSQKQFLATVNNDTCADAVAYFDSGSLAGTWYVALSNCSNGFGAPTVWASNFGNGSQNQFLTDIDNDQMADITVFYGLNSTGLQGKWMSATSNGTNAFINGRYLWYSNSTYGDGHGYGSQQQFMADIDNDGRADPIAYFDTGSLHGYWYAATTNSTANGLSTAYQWIAGSGTGAGSNKQFVGDVNGDNYLDAVFYYHDGSNPQSTNPGNIPQGTWYAAMTNGSSTPGGANIWKYNHGNSSFLSSTNQLLGDVDGPDSTGNKTLDPVVFDNSGGAWRAIASPNYVEPPRLNTWEGWDVKYRPIINGTPGIYDTIHDTSVIDQQLNEIDNANIDYILFDLTNSLSPGDGYVFDGAKAVCTRIAAHNANGGSLKYAVAVGGIQGGNHSPSITEGEAQIVEDQFVNDSTCGSSYYNYQNKPLLAAYGTYDQILGSNGWVNYGSKTSSNDFTVIPAIDTYPNTDSSVNYSSKTGAGCGTVPSGALPSSSLYGSITGWGLPYGTLGSGPIMTVMPGWSNKTNMRVLRYQSGISDYFYQACGWNRILSANPSMVIINSFNEYVERTAVEPASTSLFTDTLEQWPSNDFYWNMTVSKIGQL